ncbi:MAG: hypothetical protein HQL19_05565 [Candidatus Omnitrophica bacterium]|nr:hypothetical protein [Candidatus Omnitrophota bacterium]
MKHDWNDPGTINTIIFIVFLSMVIFEMNAERKRRGLQWAQIWKLKLVKMFLILAGIVVIFGVLLFIAISVIMNK